MTLTLWKQNFAFNNFLHSFIFGLFAGIQQVVLNAEVKKLQVLPESLKVKC